MKKLLILLLIPLFTACAAISEPILVSSGDTMIYEYVAKGPSEDFEDPGKVFYFEYPLGAEIEDNGGSGKGSYGRVLYEDCIVEFWYGRFIPEEDDASDFEYMERDGIIYESVFDKIDGHLKSYSADVSDLDFSFTASDIYPNVTGCIDFINTMADSVSDVAKYVNNQFGFMVGFLSDYKIEYMSDNKGVIYKKWVEIEKPSDFENMKEQKKIYYEDYRVEMRFFAQENASGYNDLSEFIFDKYPGYSTEFVNYAGVAGVYINEEKNGNSVRHFCALSEDGDTIYEAYLEVPSIHFNEHGEFFVGLVEGLELF